MNYEMNKKRNLVYRRYVGHGYTIFLNSAVADVKDGSRSIRWGRKEIKTQMLSPSIEQRNCNNVERSGVLRPLGPGPRDILPRKRSRESPQHKEQSYTKLPRRH